MIPYGKHSVSNEDIQSVVDVLKSDYITQGKMVSDFENEICRYTGASFGTAVNSGTSALHISCLALGLGKGDWLWTSAITFVASANCGLYCGASVDFVDIHKDTWNICTDKLATKLEIAEKTGKLPKILVVVHFCGLPCDMEEIHVLSIKYGFHIVEDACHALGGKYQAEPIGNCRYSDVTVFSFHPVKAITTGEGGMVVTSNKDIADKMNLLRTHGITRQPELMAGEIHGPWYYEQIELGYNYRMTDIQAVLGLSQLKRLNEFVSKRHKIARRYNTDLENLPVQLPYMSDDRYSGMHIYVIRLNLDKCKKTHRQIFECFRKQGIGVNLHYIPLHMQPYHKKSNRTFDDLKEAERYYEEAITLPLFPTMSDEDYDTVISVTRNCIQ